MLPTAQFTAVEINDNASEILKKTGATVHTQSLLDSKSEEVYELVLIRGVLIHLNPAMLKMAYKVIAESSNRYVLMSEYYSPVPVAIEYRGEKDRLFKRDFAGEFMAENKQFKLLDYGFHYRNGTYYGDDQTWFFMEKTHKY